MSGQELYMCCSSCSFLEATDCVLVSLDLWFLKFRPCMNPNFLLHQKKTGRERERERERESMSNLRAAICRPHVVLTSFLGRRRLSSLGFSFRFPNSVVSSPSSVFSPCFDPVDVTRFDRFNPRRTIARASKWDSEKSPYEILELERDADEEKIKFAYRRLAKYYHPDVYDGRGTLEEGETAEARFIKIQAAYELLIDEEKRWQYDKDHRVNPMKASQAWMEWLIKKRKAFDQRGDMAIAAWAEQQQREMNLRARRLSRSKAKKGCKCYGYPSRRWKEPLLS